MRSFNSNEDIYDFVSEIIVIAEAHGDHTTAQLIQDAIDRGGFLPSERLGELSLVLKALKKKKNATYLLSLHREIDLAINVISEAIKDANRFR